MIPDTKLVGTLVYKSTFFKLTRWFFHMQITCFSFVHIKFVFLKGPLAFLKVKYVIFKQIVSYNCEIKRIQVENEICAKMIKYINNK
jgi:hypothetical protein